MSMYAILHNTVGDTSFFINLNADRARLKLQINLALRQHFLPEQPIMHLIYVPTS
jgi:hypothetical protein